MIRTNLFFKVEVEHDREESPERLRVEIASRAPGPGRAAWTAHARATVQPVEPDGAPATLDLEVRYQLLDTNANPLTREDIVLFLKAIERLLLQKGLQNPAGTFVQPGPGI